VADTRRHLRPIHRRAAPIVRVRHNGLRRLPGQCIGVIDAALDGRERAAFLRQLHAGQHGMIAHKLDHLCGKLLPLRRAVADAAVVHQIAQAHNAQANAPGIEGGFFQLWHRRDVGIGIHHIVEEAHRQRHRGAQFLPIYLPGRALVLRQVHRAQAAVLVWAEPLFATIVYYQAIGNKGMRIGLLKVINGFTAIRLNRQNSRQERLLVWAAAHPR